MSTSPETMDFICDQLRSLNGVRTRKMFGEYALYLGEKVVALVCDEQLFVKMTPAGREWLGERLEEGEAYPGSKPYIVVGAEDLEDPERLCQLIRITADAVPLPKPKKPKAPKMAAKPKAAKKG